jgi:hypothetical protein
MRLKPFSQKFLLYGEQRVFTYTIYTSVVLTAVVGVMFGECLASWQNAVI